MDYNFSPEYLAKVAKGENVGPMDSADNLLGGMSTSQEQDEITKAANVDTLDYLKKGFESTFLYGGYQWAERKFQNTDESFNMDDHKAELHDGVPAQYWPQFAGVRSLAEGQLLKSQIQKELQDQQLMSFAGARGIVGYALGGLLDVDAPLTFLSGGSYLSEKTGAAAAKLGMQGTRLASSAETAAAGLQYSTAIATGNATIRPTGDWSDIPAAGLGGIILGGVGGAILHGKPVKDSIADHANEAVAAARKDFAENLQNGSAGTRTYGETASNTDTVFDTEAHKEIAAQNLEQQMADLEIKHDSLTSNVEQQKIKDQMAFLADQRIAQLQIHGNDSVGAASMKSGGPSFEGMSPAQIEMREQSIKYNATNGISSLAEFAFPNSPMGNAARKMYEGIQKTPWATDFDRLFNSNSPIASALAFKTLESPIGIVRNNKSASMLHDIYMNNISHDVNVNYNSAFNKWAAEKKLKQPTANAMNDPITREMFDKEFHTEMQSRLHDKASSTQSPAIKELADHADSSSAAAVKILQGRDGETPVRGSEHLQETPGWWPQRHSGAKLNKMLDELKGKIKDPRATIEDTLAKQYQRLHGWSYESSMKYAKAVTRRSIAKEEGIDTNISRMLDQNGKEYVRQFLVDNGISVDEAQKMIDSLKGLGADKSKQNFLKARVDMDTRTPIPGTGKTLMDIMDLDIPRVWTSYSRQAAGAAAMARHGIQMKDDWADIVSAIKADETANGGRTLPDNFFDGLRSHFSGNAIAGGLNPWVRRANQLTNLSLLNSLGLTQLAETGVNIAALGVDVFRKTASKEVKQLLDGKGDIQSMRDLSHWLSPIDGEHMAIREDLMLDSIRSDPGHYSELGSHLDKILIKGQRIQGYVTGFYLVKQLQQRIAIRGMMHRLGEMYNGGKLIAENRLMDMGLDAKTSERIGKYFKNGTIEYEADGGIKALHPDKWNPSDFEDFVAALNRHTHQVVQRAMKGEDSIWMHRDMGALFMHLKNFTMLSLQKQLLRNMRLTDPVATTSFIYGLGTAAAVYAARQALNGRTDRLDPIDITKGAIGLSNMTSVIPSWTDPIMSALGLEHYKIGQYGTYGAAGDILPIPPMYPTLNRLAKAPAAVGRILTGTNSNSDVYAAQSIPIIGNMTGLSYLWGKLRTDHVKPADSTPATPDEGPKPPASPTPEPAQKSDAVKKGETIVKKLEAR